MKTVQRVFAEGDRITAEQINALQAEPGSEPAAPKDALDQRELVLNAAAQRQASYVA